MVVFQCTPFDEILHPGSHPDAVCISKLSLLFTPSVLNSVEDFYILILPISTVWKLQMSMRRKVTVFSVIGFGSSAVIIACFRLVPLFELYSSPDTSWVLGKMVIVAALEIQFAIIAVNLPSLKALWKRYTNDSSGGSEHVGSNSKGYKLSSYERRTGGSVSGGKWGTGLKSKGSRGSVTRLERGMKSTEAEEESFRPGDTSLHVPMKEGKGEPSAIKVTTDVKVMSI
ncbi:hypothetical protein EJ02DRAFT_487885 [Clathrospora elynae]|uniref:Rhodopsin domain-containing protein n=1 Tax=Clathrospora elynae TaxID=706981 RepID=A0A6A5ST95_9PLEO|nr:hypothetical protein EJ02DRAFT_487885 [Clathrospora elynae]